MIEAISLRRDALVREAEILIEDWFAPVHGKQPIRFYAPHVRTIERDDRESLTIQIYWTRRKPIDGFKGKEMHRGKHGPVKMTKVSTEFIAARKRGEPYPLASFPLARDEEREDISRVERRLAPIRSELQALGRLMVHVAAYRRSADARGAAAETAFGQGGVLAGQLGE